MEKILKVHSVNDYARYIGAEELHPLISVIHYDELEHCRHSLNNYDVYAIFIADVRLDSLTYGLVNYDLHRHALMCVAPGQIGGKTDEGEEIQTQGWALLFDPALLSSLPMPLALTPVVVGSTRWSSLSGFCQLNTDCFVSLGNFLYLCSQKVTTRLTYGTEIQQ